MLPVASAIVVANGLQGTYLHWRGIVAKPGGTANLRYNIEMGPPAFAPLLASLVGGMGLLAAVLRREGDADALPCPNRPAPSPRVARGRFPGFDVLDEVDRWDDVTAGVVLARLDPQPDFSFFTPPSRPPPTPCSTCCWPSSDEPEGARCCRWSTSGLALDQTDGWFYEDMPEDRRRVAGHPGRPRRRRPQPSTVTVPPARPRPAGRSSSRPCRTPTRGTT